MNVSGSAMFFTGCSFTDSWRDGTVRIGPFPFHDLTEGIDKVTMPELPQCGQKPYIHLKSCSSGHGKTNTLGFAVRFAGAMTTCDAVRHEHHHHCLCRTADLSNRAALLSATFPVK